jgi:CrcB protein
VTLASLQLVWMVAIGGAIGSVGRYLVTLAVQSRVDSGFPAGTLLVNVTGAFLLGLIMRYSVQSFAITAEMRLLLTTGLCGGYTTFSAFSYESARMIEDGEWRTPLLYIVLSVILSLAAMFLGFRAAQWTRGVWS